MPFTRVRSPFIGGSQEPIRLLESITPVELASCVPRVKITKIDPRSGRPADDVRPLMFDLIETPQFGAVADGGFGLDQDTFKERSLVSLQSLKVEHKLSYGLMLFREVAIQFTVHRPGLIFDRSSKIPWREIFEEGSSFSLEYGWSADPGLVKNDLFNGNGHITDEGATVRSTQIVLLIVYRYILKAKQNGEVDVTVLGLENGDIALREARFSDAFDSAFGVENLFGFVRTDDRSNADRIRVLLDGIPERTSMGRGKFYTLGDVLDQVVAPMIEAASRAFGYAIAPSLSLANFNVRAGQQSDQYGSRDMSGLSIANFLIPVARLKEELSRHFAAGRAMFLRNFIEIIIGMVNATESWGPDVTGLRAKPEVMLRADTIRRDDQLRLNIVIYDRKLITDVFRDSDRIPLESQTRERVMATLESKRVPVLEFARAGTLILEANFEMQPDPLLQAIQVENAYGDRKDRLAQTRVPDAQWRKGQSGAKDIVPASILEGEVTTQGNFVLETFGLIWIEFFGSAAISGIFHALEKIDTLEPGRFVSQVKFISEGLDPLNTRRRLTDQEFKDAEERARQLREGKK